MKFTPTQIRALATNSQFPPENLEKVLRLRELLIEFHKHGVLKGKLVLKGGTALNLFYLDLARLSVDIDLNYIGNIDREAAIKERTEIVKAIEQISGGLGYKLQNGVDDYALREWYLNPLLRADDRPTAEKMLSVVSPLLETVLDHERESSYLEAMASGKYQPELLFPEQPEIVERIRQHPALLWKAQNVAEHLSQPKKRP